jgi:hypothetical protein
LFLTKGWYLLKVIQIDQTSVAADKLLLRDN